MGDDLVGIAIGMVIGILAGFPVTLFAMVVLLANRPRVIREESCPVPENVPDYFGFGDIEEDDEDGELPRLQEIIDRLFGS